MLGRSCRTRGVCDGILYVNTGEDETTFRRRIKAVSYSEVLDYIKLLQKLAKLSEAPTKIENVKQGKVTNVKVTALPEVEALYKEWSQGRYIISLDGLKQAVLANEKMAAIAP